MRTLALAWDGEAFWPLSSDRLLAREAYGQGEIIAFAEAKDRSSPSHRHYFAALREAWVNLPEGYAERLRQLLSSQHRLLQMDESHWALLAFLLIPALILAVVALFWVPPRVSGGGPLPEGRRWRMLLVGVFLAAIVAGLLH